MIDWKQLALTKPVNAYTIFCGELDYSKSILKYLEADEKYGFEDWKIHVELGNSKLSSDEIIKGFDKFYYQSFVNTVFPNHDVLAKQNIDEVFAKETKRLSKEINKKVAITIRGNIYNIQFEYLDLFFFPHEIAFYCFKCDLSGFSMDEITLINS